jgi:hypothetical protein
MTVQQLEYLADGLSVSACGQTLVLDRTRVRTRRDGHDVAFIVAGTGLAPRLHLRTNQLASSTWEDISGTLQRIVRRLVCTGRN